ncbi:MAG: hypothetical protein K0R47_1288 [Brevibacillus sp.]|nr:hypothetical protein [Brevibacillus sp.]
MSDTQKERHVIQLLELRTRIYARYITILVVHEPINLRFLLFASIILQTQLVLKSLHTN